MYKKKKVIIPAVVLLIVGFFYYYLNSELVIRNQVLPRLSDNLRMPVYAKTVEFSLLDGLAMKTLFIGKEESSHLKLNELDLRYDAFSLLSDKPVVKKLHIKGARGNLLFDNQGGLQGRRYKMVYNGSSFDTKPKAKPTQARPRSNYQINEVHLENVNLRVSRINSNWKKEVYNVGIRELKLNELSPGKEFSLSSQGKIKLAIDGSLGLEANDFTLETSGSFDIQGENAKLKSKFVLNDLKGDGADNPFDGRSLHCEATCSYQEERLTIEELKVLVFKGKSLESEFMAHGYWSKNKTKIKTSLSKVQSSLLNLGLVFFPEIINKSLGSQNKVNKRLGQWQEKNYKEGYPLGFVNSELNGELEVDIQGLYQDFEGKLSLERLPVIKRSIGKSVKAELDLDLGFELNLKDSEILRFQGDVSMDLANKRILNIEGENNKDKLSVKLNIVDFDLSLCEFLLDEGSELEGLLSGSLNARREKLDWAFVGNIDLENLAVKDKLLYGIDGGLDFKADLVGSQLKMDTLNSWGSLADERLFDLSLNAEYKDNIITLPSVNIVLGKAVNQQLLPQLKGVSLDGSQFNLNDVTWTLNSREKNLSFSYEISDVGVESQNKGSHLLKSTGLIASDFIYNSYNKSLSIKDFSLYLDEWRVFEGAVNVNCEGRKTKIDLGFTNVLDLDELKNKIPQIKWDQVSAEKAPLSTKSNGVSSSYNQQELYLTAGLKGIRFTKSDVLTQLKIDLANRGNTFVINTLSYRFNKEDFMLRASLLNNGNRGIKISEISGPLSLTFIDTCLNIVEPERTQSLSGMVHIKKGDYAATGNTLDEIFRTQLGELNLDIYNLRLMNFMDWDKAYKESLRLTLGLDPDKLQYEEGNIELKLMPNKIQLNKASFKGTSGSLLAEGLVDSNKDLPQQLTSSMRLQVAFPGGEALKAALRFDPKLLTRSKKVAEFLDYNSSQQRLNFKQALKMNGQTNDGQFTTLLDNTKHKLQREFDHVIGPLISLTKGLSSSTSTKEKVRSIWDIGLGIAIDELKRKNLKKREKEKKRK